MALVGGALYGSYRIRKVPSFHAYSGCSARTLALSFSKISCSPLHQSRAEAGEEDEQGGQGRKSAARSVPHKGDLSLHVSSRHGHRRPKVSGVQNDTQFDPKDDDKFMQEALREAERAAALGEVPVGAVLVSQGRVVARAHNRVERENDPTAHAEMICIRSAARHIGGWRLLVDSTLYVTLEPCPMCAGALLQARVGAVVWGARNSLLGADGSWVSLFPRRPLTDGSDEQLLGSGTNGAAQERSLIHPFNPNIVVRGGVLASQSSEMMKAFFRQRRKESVKAGTKAGTTGPSIFSRLIFVILTALHEVVSFVKNLGLRRMLHLRQLHWKQRF